MPPLGIEHHRIHKERGPLPLEPRPLGSPGQIGAVPALQHQPLRQPGVPLRWVRTERRQMRRVVEGLQGRQVEAGAGVCGHEGLQPGPALAERQGAQVVVPLGQQVIGPDRRRVGGHQRRRGGLAVQPLLQVGKAAQHLPPAHHQLPVDHPFEGQRPHQVGKGRGDVLSRAGIEPRLSLFPHRLDPHPVPLPLRGEQVGRDRLELGLLVEGVGQHGGTEAARGVRRRAGAAALQPGEQVRVGRGEAVPQLLQIAEDHGSGLGNGQHQHRLPGQAHRQPHPQPAGDQLQQRPAPVGVQGVQPGLHPGGGSLAVGPLQLLHHTGQGRRGIGPGAGGPDQGGGLRQIADEVIGQGEQPGVDPLGDGLAYHGGLGGAEDEVPGHGGQGIAPLRIRRDGQIVPHEDQLGIARCRQGQAVQQMGEVAHGSDPDLTGRNSGRRRPGLSPPSGPRTGRTDRGCPWDRDWPPGGAAPRTPAGPSGQCPHWCRRTGRRGSRSRPREGCPGPR